MLQELSIYPNTKISFQAFWYFFDPDLLKQLFSLNNYHCCYNKAKGPNQKSKPKVKVKKRIIFFFPFWESQKFPYQIGKLTQNTKRLVNGNFLQSFLFLSSSIIIDLLTFHYFLTINNLHTQKYILNQRIT